MRLAIMCQLLSGTFYKSNRNEQLFQLEQQLSHLSPALQFYLLACLSSTTLDNSSSR